MSDDNGIQERRRSQGTDASPSPEPVLDTHLPTTTTTSNATNDTVISGSKLRHAGNAHVDPWAAFQSS